MSPTITVKPGYPYARLLGVGAVRGSRIVDNAEMCTMIDSSDEWIQQRTGIIERRWVGEGQDVKSLAIEAATKALASAGMQPSDIDAVVVATISYTRQTPSLAALVAGELGCGDVPAFDLSAACAGFSYGVSLADSMVRSGSATNVLLIASEVLTDITNFEDRGTAFLFADGAGAVVIGPSDEPAIGPAVWGSDGTRADAITMPTWLEAMQNGVKSTIVMQGNQVYKWSTTEVNDKAMEAIAAAGLTPDDIDVFIPHQANNRITDAMLRRLKLPDTVKVARDIKHMGNSSGASIPVAMDAMLASGEAKSGDLALIVGFGAGLVYSSQVLRLP